MTINEAMVLMRTLRSRIADLQTIRNANAIRVRRWDILPNGAEKERVEVEPQYDPRVVDKKIVEIETIIFKLDSAIKHANAMTKVDVEGVDVERLLTPIQ